MDGVVLLDSEKDGGTGDETKKEKMSKGNSIRGAQRKRLADITNLQQQPPKFPNEQPKNKVSPAVAKDYAEQLHKENMALVKILADRNTIIELSGVELQKLRTNLEKLKEQNWKLAQANNQILADLNSGKERLHELQHELGCKNGILKAMKLELEGKRKAKKVPCEIVPNKSSKVGRIENDHGAETSLANIGDDKFCNTERRLSKPQSLELTTLEQAHAIEKVDNKRHCLRRQSARFKSEKLEPSGDFFEIEDANFPVSHLCDDQVNDNCPKSSGEIVQEGNTAPKFEPEKIQRSSSGMTLRRVAEDVHAKQKVDNKRPCLRRKSARLNSEILEPSEKLSEVDDTKYHVSRPHDPAKSNFLTSGATMLQENEKGNTSPEVESQKIQRSFEGKPLGRAAEDVHAKELVNKRCCLRRQSARLRSQKLEPTEDLILIEASKILVPTLPVDLVRENCPKLLEGTVQEENGGGTSAKSESQEIWKSYKRPLRQAAEKVQSYKEISINVKMRRPE